MNENERKNHCYLGDGVYAEYDGYHIILRTGNHRDELCDNKIYMESNVLYALDQFVKKINERNESERDINFEVGDKVRYKASHGFAEYGIVTSIEGNKVWVRYSHQPEDACGQLTPINLLTKI